MQELCKRALLFTLLFFILAISTTAIEECKGTIDTDDVPCLVFLNVDNSTTPCPSINISYYNESVNLFNHSMTQYNFFTCNSTFNQTSVGTYTFYYSTGDTGSIIVEEGDRMIYLLYFAMGLIVLLFVIGYKAEDYTFLSLSGILAMIFGLYVYINGFNALDNLITQAIAIITIMLGFYVMIVSIYQDTAIAEM